MTAAETEEALVAAAVGGSAPAFARLVDRNQQAVRGFLRRLCGDWAEADDLAQETFLAAWSNIRRFDGRGALKPWLCGIAYRKWMTGRRGVARRARRDGASIEGAETVAVSTSDGRLDAARALQALPEEQRAAVALCLAAEFSHAEAAEALGLPLGTVKSHVQRGRAKLLEILSDPHER